MKPMRTVAFAVAALLLGACTTQPRRESLPPVAGPAAAHQAARTARLAALPQWSMSGRIAVSSAGQGGSGRIEWRQDGPAYAATLSAPVTRQSWRVSGGPAGAAIEGLSGGPRQGADASALVFEATRWRVPVDRLDDWLLGLAGADDVVHFGGDGRVERIDGEGWTVAYADWRMVDGVELPGRIEAVQGESRVRLAVDDWTLGSGPP